MPPQAPQTIRQRQRAKEPRPPDNRPSASKRGYGAAWGKASKAYRAEHPLCVICQAEGRLTPAMCVDHVVPHKGDMDLFWDSDGNWQSLCSMHHSKKTASEDGGFGNVRKR